MYRVVVFFTYLFISSFSDILFNFLDKQRLKGKPLKGGGNVTALGFLQTRDFVIT